MAEPLWDQGRDKITILDALVSPSGLFGTAVETVVGRFKEAMVQSAAFNKKIPCCDPGPSA